MKRHVAALAFLGLALATQACNITVDLPKTLPSLLVSGSVPPATPQPTAIVCTVQLKDLDSDGDGALNISEFNTVVNPPYDGCPTCGARAMVDPEPVLKKYDRNKDGKLQQDEFCAYLSGNPQPTPSATPTAQPSAIIEPPPPSIMPTVQPTVAPTARPTATPSLGQYTATPADFDALDADKDGKLTWDEEVAYQTRNGALPAGAKDKIYDLFRQADTNQNGTLERAEYDFARS